MNPDYGKYYYKDWEKSRPMSYTVGSKTFWVSVLSGPGAGASLDYYCYSEAKRKMNELLTQGVCAIMRLDNGS
jgi:hypothetical protein